MNPLAKPATVLGPNAAREAHSAYMNKVVEDVEKKRQREELKKAKVDEALLPPDIDASEAFQYEVGEIMDDLDQYSNYKADLATMGVDITSPDFKSKFYQQENKIREKVIKSKQHQALYDKAVQILATNPDDIDVEATQQRLAEFVTAANQGVDAAHDYLSKNGTLYVEKPFDIAAYGNEIAEQYKPSVIESDPTKQGSFMVSETITDVTPENKLGAGEQFLRSKKAKQEAEYLYGALTPSAQAEYEQKAINAGGQPGSGLAMFATEKYLQPHWAYGRQVNTQNLPAAGGGGGGDNKKPPQSNMLVDMVVGTISESPNYVQKDAQGYLVSEGFVGQTLGQFNSITRTAAGTDAQGNVIYDEKSAVKPIIIQKVIKNPKDGLWYVQTNDSVENKKGVSVGQYKYMQKYTEAQFKEMMYKLATQTGEWTSEDIDAYAESKGYYGPDKSLNVPKPAQEEVTDIFFNGKTEMVPKSKMKVVNGVKVFPLSNGTWVKWDEKSKSWIKSNYQGEAQKPATNSNQSKKPVTLSKGSLDDL